MSGPKVVRVVTREERIAICSSLVAKLDAALASLNARCAKHSDAEGLAIVSSSTQRRAALLSLIQEDKFDLAETQMRQEIGFIQATKDGVIDRAAKAAAAAREQASRRRQAATTLANELERKLPGQNAELVASLKRVAGESKPDNSADAVLSRAMAALTPEATPTQLSDAQRSLAKSLQTQEGSAAASEPTWAFPHARDKRIAALQIKLSQLDILNSESAAEFADRLAQLELQPESARRNMKLDGLVLDISSRVEEVRREEESLDRARALEAEIGIWMESTTLSAIGSSLHDAIARRDITQLPSLEARATSALEQANQQAAAAARREAILSGLASLGYQVNESMSTSWVQDGRVVLKKSEHDQHGIELASAADAQRLQVRAVAFSASLPSAANLAAETAWCGDFSKLQDCLKQQSGELVIERAMAVGAVPLKVMEAPGAWRVESAAVNAPRVRQLR